MKYFQCSDSEYYLKQIVYELGRKQMFTDVFSRFYGQPKWSKKNLRNLGSLYNRCFMS